MLQWFVTDRNVWIGLTPLLYDTVISRCYCQVPLLWSQMTYFGSMCLFTWLLTWLFFIFYYLLNQTSLTDRYFQHGCHSLSCWKWEVWYNYKPSSEDLSISVIRRTSSRHPICTLPDLGFEHITLKYLRYSSEYECLHLLRFPNLPLNLRRG